MRIRVSVGRRARTARDSMRTVLLLKGPAHIDGATEQEAVEAPTCEALAWYHEFTCNDTAIRFQLNRIAWSRVIAIRCLCTGFPVGSILKSV